MRDCRHLVSLIPLELYHSRSGGPLVATLLNLPLPSKDVERMVEADEWLAIPISEGKRPNRGREKGTQSRPVRVRGKLDCRGPNGSEEDCYNFSAFTQESRSVIFLSGI